MKYKKLHTPDGVKDFYPKQLMLKKYIEDKISNESKFYGYLPISSPSFEYIEVFSEIGTYSDGEIFKFLDRYGNTLALRLDMTTAIARIAATTYKDTQTPLRFSYVENSYRQTEHYTGKNKELAQAGVELIGDSSNEAIAEVIMLCVKSLLATGLEDFRIDVGSVAFFKSIVEDACLSEIDREEFQKFVLYKDFVSAEKLLAINNCDGDLLTLFRELPFLVGKKDIITKIKGLVKNEKALIVIDELVELYDLLVIYGIENYISFDLSMIGQLDYYNGVIFKGYTYNSPSYIVVGGQYDNLLGSFGADKEAVGFAIEVNNLISAFAGKEFPFENQEVETLIMFDSKSKKTAIEVSEELRDSGIYIENSFFGEDIVKAKSYAKEKGIKGILFFKDINQIEVINIEDETSETLSVSDFMK